MWLWSVRASAFAVLAGALNRLRSYRQDRTLAWVALTGTLGWLAASIGFGVLIARPFDPRVVAFLIMAGGLSFFTLRSALSARP